MTYDILHTAQCSTLRFWAGCPNGCPSGNQPKCFGCPWYNFSCPDIIQMAEIPQDWHMLVFANEESNCTGKKRGFTSFYRQISFHALFCEAVKPQHLSLTPLPTENNCHEINLRLNGIGYWQLPYMSGFMNVIWLVGKTLMVKNCHFRRNCTEPLDHPC